MVIKPAFIAKDFEIPPFKSKKTKNVEDKHKVDALRRQKTNAKVKNLESKYLRGNTKKPLK